MEKLATTSHRPRASVAPRMARAIQPNRPRADGPCKTALKALPVRVGMAALHTLVRIAPRMKLATKGL